VNFSVVLVLTFLSASVGIAAGFSIWTDLQERDSSRARHRVESEFRRQQRKQANAPALFKLQDSTPLENLTPPPESETALDDEEASDWRSRLNALLLQSGLPLTRKHLFGLSVSSALALAAVGLAVHGLLLSLLGLLVGSLLPLLYVVRCRRIRHGLFVAQLPAAFELMARVMRAGHSVPQSFQAVAEAFEQPIAGEFAHCQEQQNLGLLPEITFRDMARRTGVLEIKIFVMAMLIQRQTGGNLSEVLDRLAGLVRERVRLRNHVRTLTAEGRLQALVLLVLPVVMFFVMRCINRQYADVLLDHLGLLAAIGGSMGLGALWIRKIVNFDI
jgi:tight adherence protein B